MSPISDHMEKKLFYLKMCLPRLTHTPNMMYYHEEKKSSQFHPIPVYSISLKDKLLVGSCLWLVVGILEMRPGDDFLQKEKSECTQKEMFV